MTYENEEYDVNNEMQIRIKRNERIFIKKSKVPYMYFWADVIWDKFEKNLKQIGFTNIEYVLGNIIE